MYVGGNYKDANSFNNLHCALPASIPADLKRMFGAGRCVAKDKHKSVMFARLKTRSVVARKHPTTITKYHQPLRNSRQNFHLSKFPKYTSHNAYTRIINQNTSNSFNFVGNKSKNVNLFALSWVGILTWLESKATIQTKRMKVI